jgi:hypothetical protein
MAARLLLDQHPLLLHLRVNQRPLGLQLRQARRSRARLRQRVRRQTGGKRPARERRRRTGYEVNLVPPLLGGRLARSEESLCRLMSPKGRAAEHEHRVIPFSFSSDSLRWEAYCRDYCLTIPGSTEVSSLLPPSARLLRIENCSGRLWICGIPYNAARLSKSSGISLSDLLTSS